MNLNVVKKLTGGLALAGAIALTGVVGFAQQTGQSQTDAQRGERGWGGEGHGGRMGRRGGGEGMGREGGVFGRFSFKEDVAVSEENRKTGKLVAMAMVKSVRQLASTLVVAA